MRAEQLLPDDQDRLDAGDTTIRKGTVGAFLINARVLTDPMRRRPSAPAQKPTCSTRCRRCARSGCSMCSTCAIARCARGLTRIEGCAAARRQAYACGQPGIHISTFEEST